MIRDAYQTVVDAVEAFATNPGLCVRVDMPGAYGGVIRVLVCAIGRDGQARVAGVNFTDARAAGPDAIVRVGVALGRVYEEIETSMRKEGVEAVDVDAWSCATYRGGFE